MVHIPCIEEVYFHIRNKSGYFTEMNFLKAGLYCSPADIKLHIIKNADKDLTLSGFASIRANCGESVVGVIIAGPGGTYN